MDALEQSIIQGRPDDVMMASRIATVLQDVAELPYDSPADQPDVMLVTGDELRLILERTFCPADIEFNYFNQDVPEVHSTAQDVPEPNAPSPVVMRLELINIIVAKSGGKISFTKAGSMVDSIIAKQMIYYASMADPEVTTDEAARVAAVVEAKAMIEALIRQGGVVADYMADKPLWIRTATRARETCAKLVELIT